MEYTPYARQLRGRNPGQEARARAFFEEMVARIDLKALLTEFFRDKCGVVYP